MSNKKSQAQLNAEAIAAMAVPPMPREEAMEAFKDAIAEAEAAGKKWQIVMPSQAGASPSLRVDN